MEQKKFDFSEGKMDGAIGIDCSMPNVSMCNPIHEAPQERVCHRYINYEIPHIMPCNTRIVNHHIYRHTFTPCYTCCEENVCEHVYDRKCQ